MPRDEVTLAAGDCPRCEYLEYLVLMYRSVIEAQAPLIVDLHRRRTATAG